MCCDIYIKLLVVHELKTSFFSVGNPRSQSDVSLQKAALNFSIK